MYTFFKVLASRTMKISEGILANQPSLTMASSGCEGRGVPHQPIPD